MKGIKKNPLKNRLFVLLLAFCVLFFGITIRLFYWQIIKGGGLAVQAQKQYNYLYELKARRGQIYFNDKTPAVTNQPGYLLYANPHDITSSKEDRSFLAKELAAVIVQNEPPVASVSAEELMIRETATISALLKNDLYWVPIKKKIDEDLKNKIDALRIKGLGFEEDLMRFYPEASMAAHLLGFVGSDANGVNKGYFGLEGYYDREIKGRGGTIKTLTDAFGRPILLGEQAKEPILDGRDLVLHVDRTIQYFVEQSLDKGMEKYGAKGGSVIVMDPRTGGILAMASRPSYDPFNYQKYDQDVFKNPAVASLYEPGSTFKTLVMSAALNENLVQPDTQCSACDKQIEISGYTIRTWNNKYFPNTTMTDVIMHSDNTGMVFTARKLGLDKFYEYIRNFGIGSKTNIDLEDEESPLLRDKSQWGEIDLVTASFGQGLAVTPMQMIRAVAAIANGGYLVEPHVVKTVIKESGEEVQIKPKIIRQVISEKTSKVMTEMMVNAVDNGEAKFAKPKGFRIAGKTGTAQIPIAGHYDPSKTIASFVGFAPADDPKFIILVKLDQPQSSIFGAETAAPLFFDISKQLFTYYKIAPSN